MTRQRESIVSANLSAAARTARPIARAFMSSSGLASTRPFARFESQFAPGSWGAGTPHATHISLQ